MLVISLPFCQYIRQRFGKTHIHKKKNARTLFMCLFKVSTSIIKTKNKYWEMLYPLDSFKWALQILLDKWIMWSWTCLLAKPHFTDCQIESKNCTNFIKFLWVIRYMHLECRHIVSTQQILASSIIFEWLQPNWGKRINSKDKEQTL